VVSGPNIIMARGTQAGKTTLLSRLAAAIRRSERVVSCEEVFELRIALPDWVAMQTRKPNLEGTGEVPLRRLVKGALRMRPTRIIVLWTAQIGPPQSAIAPAPLRRAVVTVPGRPCQPRAGARWRHVCAATARSSASRARTEVARRCPNEPE
jgi:hypothetical protein